MRGERGGCGTEMIAQRDFCHATARGSVYYQMSTSSTVREVRMVLSDIRIAIYANAKRTRYSFLGFAAGLVLAGCSAQSAQTKTTSQESSMTTNHATEKQQVRDLLKSIETGDGDAVAPIKPAKPIQHNLP